MTSFVAVAVTLFLSAFAAQGAWTPANGVKELDAVEHALKNIVDNPKLSRAQLKMAKKVVDDVDQIVVQIQAGKNITKEVKAQKVGQAIQELQDLQGQFELNVVQQALTGVVNRTRLSPELAKTTKEVAESVNKVAAELEAGNHLSKEEKAKKVQGAIQQLQGLQGLLAHQEALTGNATVSRQLDVLEAKLALKKKELAKAEDEMKLMKLQKELVEKKEQLQELEHEKSSAKASKEQAAQDAKQQEDMVAKLVGMAKAMAAEKKPAKVGAEAKLPAPVQAILADLKARAANVSETIAKLDAEETAREAKVEGAAKNAAIGTQDAAKAKKMQSMLKFLGREEKRTYSKLRAAKESNLNELTDAIHGIEKGDIAAVQKVMKQMQGEVKKMEVKSHNFLY